MRQRVWDLKRQRRQRPGPTQSFAHMMQQQLIAMWLINIRISSQIQTLRVSSRRHKYLAGTTVKALTTTGTTPPVAPTRALLTRTVRGHGHRHYRSARSMSDDMNCTPGHPNMWQQVAGQSSASLKYHPPAPNHRELLVFMDRQTKGPPSSTLPKAAENASCCSDPRALFSDWGTGGLGGAYRVPGVTCMGPDRRSLETHLLRDTSPKN